MNNETAPNDLNKKETIIENAMSLLIKLIAEFFISYYLPNPLSFNSFNASALKS